jgi:hypothetical protein
MVRLVVPFLVLSACGPKAPPYTDDPRFFLTDEAAARLSVPELIHAYLTNYDVAALYASSRQCPGQNARGDSLLAGLLNLAPSHERTLDYALHWSGLLVTCRDARVAAWYREAIGHPRDDLTFALLTKALLRARDPAGISAVKQAAFDTANHPEARNAMLKLLAEELNYSGAERLDLMIESYRRAGEIPGDFLVEQAARVWLNNVPNWREALLAELTAAPGKRGAAPLLLTLAREANHSSASAHWRAAWEQTLTVLATHREASADLKAMIPIAREVAHSRN